MHLEDQESRLNASYQLTQQLSQQKQLDKELDLVFLKRLIEDNHNVLITNQLRLQVEGRDSIDQAIDDDLQEAEDAERVLESEQKINEQRAARSNIITRPALQHP